MFQDAEEGAYISSDDEIEWVLEIYSPMISEKFIEAEKNNDYYEMRRLSYWALQNSFNSEWNETVTFGFDLPEGNPVATLRHHTNAKYGGVRVYYTNNKYVDGKYVGIMAKSEPLYFKPNSGKYFDAYYPVDINLYEGDGKIATGDSYYGDDDFTGIFGESSLIIGMGRGSGTMVGYMRGFGYCEYYYTMKGYGLSVSLISSGVITGKFVGGTRGNQNPSNLAGRGEETVIGGGNAGATTWTSIGNDGNIIFTGSSVGLVAGYNGTEKLISDLLQKILNMSGGQLKTCTDLLFPLPQNSTYNEEIKNSFSNCCCEEEIEKFCPNGE